MAHATARKPSPNVTTAATVAKAMLRGVITRIHHLPSSVALVGASNGLDQTPQ